MITAHSFWFQQPTYDPLVANQEHFDPITLMPVFPAPVSEKLAGPSTSTISLPTDGSGLNFYVPPPFLAEQPDINSLPKEDRPQAPVVPAWKEYLPYMIGVGTILLLLVIWWIIHKKRKS